MDGVAIDLGFIQIYWYAIFIMLGIFVAYLIAVYLAKEKNIVKKDIDDLFYYGVFLSIIGARLYYVVFNLDYYLANPIKIIMINEGGLAIHGGIITAFVWGYFFTKKRGINMLDIFDIGATGFLIAQSIGRWGNFTNQEAHGPSTTKNFLESLYLPDFVINGMYINGSYYHPTFLYEAIWNFIGFLIVFFFRKSLFKRKGDVFCFFIIWYSFIRIFIEELRTDSLYIGDVKVAQLVSVLGIIFAVIFFIVKNKKLGVSNENSDSSVSQE